MVLSFRYLDEHVYCLIPRPNRKIQRPEIGYTHSVRNTDMSQELLSIYAIALFFLCVLSVLSEVGNFRDGCTPPYSPPLPLLKCGKNLYIENRNIEDINIGTLNRYLPTPDKN